MTINERFQQIINDSFYGNKRAFSKAIGISASVVENIVGKRKGKPSFDVTYKVLNAFANISAEWLIMGKGNRLKINTPKTDDGTNIVSEADLIYHTTNTECSQIIPLYNLPVSEGLIHLFENPTKKSKTGELYIPNAPKCDGAICVRGDSMSPILQSGDAVCYKIVKDVNNFLWGEMYLMEIDVKGERYVMVKYIQKSEKDNGTICLISENPTHQPIEILIADIKALAHIKVCVRYNSIS